MKFIIGKKVEMTQIWRGDEVVAVTKVQAGPCVVTQVKTTDKDKYEAVQLGYGERKEKNIKKPQKGHMKNLGNFQTLREFRVEAGDLKRGDKFDAGSFQEGDNIQVTGFSKGKGFQGVVRRYGFKGTKKTHGNKDQLRMPGSIGATGPAHVFKGTRMGGRMGNDQVTTKNLEVIKVDKLKNIIYVKGAVPGARNGLVFILGDGELELVKSQKIEKKEKIIKEEPKEKAVEKKEAPVKAAEPKKNSSVDSASSPQSDSGQAEQAVKEKKSEEKKNENIEKVVEKAKEKVDKKKKEE